MSKYVLDVSSLLLRLQHFQKMFSMKIHQLHDVKYPFIWRLQSVSPVLSAIYQSSTLGYLNICKLWLEDLDSKWTKIVSSAPWKEFSGPCHVFPGVVKQLHNFIFSDSDVCIKLDCSHPAVPAKLQQYILLKFLLLKREIYFFVLVCTFGIQQRH